MISDSDDNLNTDVQPTSAEAEALLAAELARAATLLQEHGTAFRQLVRQLLADGAVPAATFGQVTGLAVRVDDAQGDATGPSHGMRGGRRLREIELFAIA